MTAAFTRVANIGRLSPKEREGYIYVGRKCYGLPASPLANPFKVSVHGVEDSLARYHEHLQKPEIQEEVAKLGSEVKATGKGLACWCGIWGGTGEPKFKCHAIVLSKLIGEL